MEKQKIKRFSDFAQEAKPMDGAKLKIDDVVNKEILIIGCKIKDSKYSKSNSSKCLTIQFIMDDKRYVLFTGSTVLIEQMEKYQHEIPFLATIKKIDRYYTLS
jgi:hypothetical protein